MTMVQEEDSGGIPEWVVTFGDMMSLLLTFFIMLVSLSEIKQEEQYQAMVESISRRFGYESAKESLVPGRSKPRNQAVAKVANDGRAKRMNLMRGGDKAQAPTGEHQRVRIVRPGEKAHSGTVVFFPEGSADLGEIAKQDLDDAMEGFTGQPQKIEIRGHTSQKPLPENSAFKNHWELAYARCWNTFEYLTENKGIDAKRIRLSVAGPYEPMHLGSDPIARRENPRVEVFMLDEVVSDLMGTREEQEKRFTDGDLP